MSFLPMHRVYLSLRKLHFSDKIIKGFYQDRMSYYAVAVGKESGVFTSWADCSLRVKGYPNARYKKFNAYQDACDFIKAHNNSASIDTTEKLKETKEANDAFIAQWPDEFTCGESDDSVLLAAIEEVEGERTSSGTKRPSSSVGESAKKLKSADKYKHESKIWQPVGMKVIRKMEFPIDAEGYVIVYTDGSCINNGSANAVAGFGVYFTEGHFLNASKPVTGRVTNNAGEIQAAIHAIEMAKMVGISKLCISTDSQFLINAVTSWIQKWKRNGWKLLDKKPVKNADDFKKLDSLLDGSISVKWNYVKGHKGIVGNEKADELARIGASLYRPET